MGIIDLLIELQIPLWAVLVLLVLGTAGTVLYKHSLERRLQDIEHEYEIKALGYGKSLEMLHEIQRRTLNALQESFSEFTNFEHVMENLLAGHWGYAQFVRPQYKKTRETARKYSAILPEEYYRSIIIVTDLGLRILAAKFTIKESAIESIKERLPESQWEALQIRLNEAAQVAQLQEFIDEISKLALGELQEEVKQIALSARVTISEQFDRSAYETESERVIDLKNQIIEDMVVEGKVDDRLAHY